jgi:polyvinyl alcohol dehydrogenase (cytochrome)
MTPRSGHAVLRPAAGGGRRAAAVAVAALALVMAPAATAPADTSGLWLSAGQNTVNSRWQADETKIGAGNAATLDPRWTFTTGGDVSATPAVDGSAVYVPDWAGNLFAIDKATGAQIWSRKVGDYTGIPGTVARTTPAIAGNRLIFGDQGGRLGVGARVMAVDRKTGDPLWVTKVDDQFSAIVTQSAVVSPDGKTAYVGVASFEEALSAFIPGYVCCTFRGSVLALSVETGQILWKTFVIPSGFSGGAVWGSTPVIDKSRRSLYVGTGNNYSVPQETIDCVTEAGEDPDAVQACNPPDNYFDSVLALDLETGAVKWATFALPFDAWNLNCIPGFGDIENCPLPTGPDFDFGQGPTLFSTGAKNTKRDLLGIGQKSGQYWAVDPDTGAVAWVTQVGPGGLTGGLQWGSATDGKRIYVAVANAHHLPWDLVADGQPTGTTVTSGIWSALDTATGRILWQTPNPTGAESHGAVSGANGVVFGCSSDPDGHMFALSAASGAILRDFASGGACQAGAAISGGTVYWGSGYQTAFGLTPNDKLFALAPQ